MRTVPSDLIQRVDATDTNKRSAEELCRQWFLPAKTLTCFSDSGERGRYHLHESDYFVSKRFEGIEFPGRI